MKEPVDHILRPQLPWRIDAGITECGYDATKVTTLTRDQFSQRLKEQGQQRTAMTTCMTCLNTAQRHGTWEIDPRRAMEREIAWECSWGRRNNANGVRLRDELLAIAALIAAHPDEFAAHITATVGRRDWLEKKAAHAATTKPKQSPVGGL